MYFEDIATIETQNRRPTNINRKFHRKGTNFGSKFSPYPGQLDLSLNNLNHSRRAEELRSYSWLYHLHSIRLVRIKFELTNQDSVSGKIVISCIAVGQLSPHWRGHWMLKKGYIITKTLSNWKRNIHETFCVSKLKNLTLKLGRPRSATDAFVEYRQVRL